MLNPGFCGRPWSPDAARTLCTSKGLRLATKLNPSLLANRTPSASNKPLPTDGLFPAHTLDLSLSAVQRCRPGWAGPRRHSPPRARSPSRPSNSSPARLSGAPVTSFFDWSAVQRCRPARAGPRRHSLGAISSLPPRALKLLYGPPQRRPGHILFRPVSRPPIPAPPAPTRRLAACRSPRPKLAPTRRLAACRGDHN